MMPMSQRGLAKLVEEMGEAAQIAGKIMGVGLAIEGFHFDEHPETLKVRMENEIADVIAASYFVMEEFGMDFSRIHERADEKKRLFDFWNKGIK